MKRYEKKFESRIISPDEKTFDKDGRIIRPGDIVIHPTFGRGQIISVDLKTYSIPFLTVEIIEGRFDGEKIYRYASEFIKKG